MVMNSLRFKNLNKDLRGLIYGTLVSLISLRFFLGADFALESFPQWGNIFHAEDGQVFLPLMDRDWTGAYRTDLYTLAESKLEKCGSYPGDLMVVGVVNGNKYLVKHNSNKKHFSVGELDPQSGWKLTPYREMPAGITPEGNFINRQTEFEVENLDSELLVWNRERKLEFHVPRSNQTHSIGKDQVLFWLDDRIAWVDTQSGLHVRVSQDYNVVTTEGTFGVYFGWFSFKHARIKNREIETSSYSLPFPWKACFHVLALIAISIAMGIAYRRSKETWCLIETGLSLAFLTALLMRYSNRSDYYGTMVISVLAARQLIPFLTSSISWEWLNRVRGLGLVFLAWYIHLVNHLGRSGVIFELHFWFTGMVLTILIVAISKYRAGKKSNRIVTITSRTLFRWIFILSVFLGAIQAHQSEWNYRYWFFCGVCLVLVGYELANLLPSGKFAWIAKAALYLLAYFFINHSLSELGYLQIVGNHIHAFDFYLSGSF